VTTGALLWTLAASVSPAAANLISPESPHSPNAEESMTLYWIGLIAAVAIIVAVNAALVMAIRKSRASRPAARGAGDSTRTAAAEGPAARGTHLRLAGGLTALAFVLFVVGVFFTERARDVPQSGPDGLSATNSLLAQRSLKSVPTGDDGPLEITATGQQWLWRYDYTGEAFSFYRLVVPVDTTVVLDLLSTDVVHSWWVPELAGKFDAVPGKRNRVFFKADEEGIYRGSSTVLSGQAYAAMRTEVEVVSPEEYTAYVDGLETDIAEAQGAVTEDPNTAGPS